MAAPLKISAKVELDASQTAQGAATAQRSIGGIGATADQVSAKLRDLDDAASGLGATGAIGGRTGPLTAEGKALDDLRAKYNPLYATMRTYQQEVASIRAAHAAGALSINEMTAAIERQRQAALSSIQALNGRNAALREGAANLNARGGGQQANTANIAAQFQDIGVTAAMGMSPLQIALQQGTQLSAVIGSMERPVAGLAAAFTSIISPVSMISIGLVAAAAAAIQYFSTAESGTEKTNRLLEEQNDTIRRASELWGDAAPAFKAYVDELDRADKISQGREAGSILAGRELEGLSERLDDIKRQATDAFRALNGDPNNAVIIRDLRNAWGDLRERMDGGQATMADLNRVQQELSRAISQYGVSAVVTFRNAFAELTPEIERAIEAAEKARGIWINGPRNVQDILSGATFTDGDQTLRASDFTPINPGRPTSRPSDLAGDPDPTNILNSDGRLTDVAIPTRKPNIFELEKEADAVDNVTKAYRRAQANDIERLQAELSLVGASSSARAELLAALQAEQRIRDMGLATGSAEAEQLRTNAGLISDLTETVKKQSAAWESWKSAGENAIDEVLDRLVSGDFKGALNGLLKDLGSFALEFGVKNPIKNSLFGSGLPTLSDMAGLLGAGQANKWIGFTGATTTLSSLLKPANDNAPANLATGLSGNTISDFAAAIRSIESSGNYRALGPITSSGDRAYGGYQVMGANVPSWTKSALGYSLTPSQFLADSSAQDAVFNHRFGGYVDRYGPSGAAQAWFGGPGSVGSGAGTDMLGTSGSEYVAKFNAALGELTTSGQAASTTIGGLGGATNNAIQGLGQFSGGLGQMSQQLVNAASSGGGGGGLLGMFGSLIGGISPTSSLWTANTTFGSFLTNGFDAGGWTGSMGRGDIAGFVHGQEFVVNAGTVAKPGVRPFLEALNDNRLPGFARGGFVDAPGAIYPRSIADDPVGRSSGTAAPVVNVYVDNPRGDRDIDEAVDRGVRRGIKAYDKQQPARKAVINKRPYVRGQ